jgi:hypothetical protein
MGRYLDLAKAVEGAVFCGKRAETPFHDGSAQSYPSRAGESVVDTRFEADRGCEKSEKSEKRSETDSCEKSEKRSAAGIAMCPPGGHAVLLQAPDGVPAEWVQGTADLLAMPAHPDWPEVGWKVLQDGALVFLKDWAAQAHRLGWDAPDLFGVHAVAPHARLDGVGLVPLLGGRPVIALTVDTVGIRAASGGTLTFRKHKSPPSGRCLVWELGGFS